MTGHAPDAASDPEVFRERWNAYVDGLAPLAGTLPDERLGELDESMSTLRDLVDEAAEQLEVDDEH